MFIDSDNIIIYYPKILICSPSVTYMISALHRVQMALVGTGGRQIKI